STHGNSLADAGQKMYRALREMRIRGVKNNIPFLENLITHPGFVSGNATVNFIQEHPELFVFQPKLDRGTKVLTDLADVIVNGNPDVKVSGHPPKFHKPQVPPFNKGETYPSGTKQLLDQLGPDAFCQWLLQEKKLHLTDTTFRDA